MITSRRLELLTDTRATRIGWFGASHALGCLVNGIAMHLSRVLIAAMLASSAVLPAHAVEVLLDSSEVMVPYGKERTIAASVRNDSQTTMCFAVQVGTSDKRISATPRVLSVCLDANQTALLPVVVYCASDAEPGTYLLEVSLRGDGVVASRMIEIVVAGEAYGRSTE